MYYRNYETCWKRDQMRGLPLFTSSLTCLINWIIQQQECLSPLNYFEIAFYRENIKILPLCMSATIDKQKALRRDCIIRIKKRGFRVFIYIYYNILTHIDVTA